MIAQELIGRPYLTILGIKATTIIWILIAIFLGLIFTMTMWPAIWRRIYQKKEIKKGKMVDIAPKEPLTKPFKFIPWQLAVIIIIIAVSFFLAGTFLGFNTAFDKMTIEDASCSIAPCQSFDINCPACTCQLCQNNVRITVPIPGG